MIRNLFSKLAFCLFLIVGLSCSFAAAEESVVPLSISDFDYYLTGTWSYDLQSGSFTGYDMAVRSASMQAVPRIGTIDSSHSQYNDSFLVRNNSEAWKMPLTSSQFRGGSYSVPALSVNTCDFVITYDLPSLDGWYTLQYDIFVGVTCNYNTYQAAVLTNSFTTDGAADFFTDTNGHTFIVQYLDHDLTVYGTYNNAPCTSDMLHFRVIYEGDQNDSTLEFHLGDYIYNHIAGWRAGGLNGGRSNTEAWYMVQSFFLPTLYYEAEPPATPTPIPTPYPGQDTQESINAGVDQIESQVSQLTNILDVHATPVPAPEELTIDETVIDVLETMTLPDLEDSRSTMSTMWQIFTPAVWFLALLASAIFVVSVFLWILRGGWL